MESNSQEAHSFIMSLAERIIQKLDKVGIVLLGIVSLFPILLFLQLAMEVPMVAIALATLGFLAWAGVRSGLLKKRKKTLLRN